MRRPYIGVTGVMTYKEADFLSNLMPENSERDVMVGVLASLKTLRGQENNYKNRYPGVGHISNIFSPFTKNTLNFVHYNTKEPNSITDQLFWLMDVAGPNCDGVQLNMVWPDADAIYQFRKRYESKKIVLQVGGRAFKAVGNNPFRLAMRVYYYRDFVDYVLLDPSGGTGTAFDTEQMMAYLRSLRDLGLEKYMGFVVAGGLSPTTLNLVEPLIPEFPDLSTDVETGVRDVNDNLDLNVAREYVRGAYSIFTKTAG